MSTAKLIYNGEEYEFPVVVGTEDEAGIDCTKLRATTGAIVLDPGYGNTGSCLSAITFIDGERGILRYRGYPIQEVAEQAAAHAGGAGRLPGAAHAAQPDPRVAEALLRGLPA